MASVLLFRPKYDPDSRSTPTFPWALLYLASVLTDRGVEVDIVDECCVPNYAETVQRLLKINRPIAVGVTSMTGDQIGYGLKFAELVREHSNAPIVWGGVHPSLLPEQTAMHELVDYAVVGEGEYAFADLVECLEQDEDAAEIPGVFLRRDGKVVGSRQQVLVDLATLPELPFYLVDAERYICKRTDLGVRRYFEICTSRGCPHHCGFCYVESVHKSCWRPIEAENAARRIAALVKRFNLDGLLFREDNFFVQRQRVETIARRLIDERLGIKWAASCRIDYFAGYTADFLKLLRDSGCALLTFGVESGSDRVLERIRKGITVKQVLATVTKMKESGIRGTYHFMGGFPGETVEEFLETCRLIDNLKAIAPETVVREMSVFAPYPGVGLIPECVKRGYREPTTLDAWIEMDWANPRRPWLEESQSRLISDAQFLIARLGHPNPVVRSWARARWRQLLRSRRGISLPERPMIEFLKRRVQHT